MIGKILRRLETLMVSATYAQAGNHEEAVKIAYPESKKKRAEDQKRLRQENRLVLRP